jgi:hypothetical protein
MKIYVASSWRNKYQPLVVAALREAGHEVYDFRNPHGRTGFSWTEIDPNWKGWTVEEFSAALQHPIACRAFESDHAAMEWAEACVMVLPCGASAHTETGWCAGKGKSTIVYCPEQRTEPELMYKEFDAVVGDLADLIALLAAAEALVP